MTDVHGSPEYSLTWKTWPMPQRVPICALRASARRISDNGCSGWATPTTRDHKGGQSDLTESLFRADGKMRNDLLDYQAFLAGWATPQTRDDHGRTANAEMSMKRMDSGRRNLDDMAALAGWCSPTAQDGSRGSLPPREQDTGVPLSQQAALAGWPTPQCTQAPNMSENRGKDYGGRRGRLTPQSVEAIMAGPDADSSRAETGKPGALNPAHSLWLMLGGMWFQAWHDAGVSALQSYMAAETPSSRKSRRVSSGPSC